MSEKTKPVLSADEWKEIALGLVRECNFAIGHLKSKGLGMIMVSQDPLQVRHWKEVMADAMEKFPGIKVDREAMMAIDLPKKDFEKWKRDRAKREQKKEVA